LIDEGKKLLVTTWNQLGNDDEGQVLTVIDTAKLARGEDSIVGTIPIGTGGGSMSLTSDGRAILIGARTSETVTRVEWARVPLLAQQAKNSADTCNQPMPDAITHIKIENGDPWHAVASPDGCWIFIRTGGPLGGLVVLQRTGGIVQPFRSIKGEENNPPGSVNSLSHSGKTLIVSKDREIEFFDVQKLTSQREDPLVGRIGDQHFLGSNGVITSDEKRLFATQHLTAWLSAIDLTESADHTLSRAAISGGIALDSNPATPVLSPDERYLYVPSFDSADKSWPLVCRDPAAGLAAATLREGSVQVVDIRNPKLPVVATLKAGCSTRRVVVSPDGNTIFATAAWDNVVLAFDVRPLRNGSAPVLIGKVPVGRFPIGIAVIDGGKKLVVANSNPNATGPDKSASLTVIDTTRIPSGAEAILGTIPAGVDARNVSVTADGHTLLVANGGSGTLELVDLERMKLEPITK
jgi:WD40 repeat protein